MCLSKSPGMMSQNFRCEEFSREVSKTSKEAVATNKVRKTENSAKRFWSPQTSLLLYRCRSVEASLFHQLL